jgi:hypothetical protein
VNLFLRPKPQSIMTVYDVMSDNSASGNWLLSLLGFDRTALNVLVSRS